MGELFTKEELEQKLEEWDQTLKKIAMDARRGLFTSEAVDREINILFYTEFETNFLQNVKGFHRVAGSKAYERLLAEYGLWKEGKVPESEVGEEWVTSRMLGVGEKVSSLDKEHIFEIWDFFCFPLNCREPCPKGITVPDILKGHHPADLVVGYDIWGESGVEPAGGFQIGEEVALTDHYGLKSHIRILEHVTDPQESIRRRCYGYVGEGMMEGYTATPREIHVHISESGRIVMLSTTRDGWYGDPGDQIAVRDFPLWREANAHYDKCAERERGMYRAIREKYGMPLD